jgi:hypothetical protein
MLNNHLTFVPILQDYAPDQNSRFTIESHLYILDIEGIIRLRRLGIPDALHILCFGCQFAVRLRQSEVVGFNSFKGSGIMFVVSIQPLTLQFEQFLLGFSILCLPEG